MAALLALSLSRFFNQSSILTGEKSTNTPDRNGVLQRARSQMAILLNIYYRIFLRLLRIRRRLRAWRLGRRLQAVHDNTSRIKDGDILAFVTIHNECVRIPYFLKYYRELGVNHFLFIDNNSKDGSLEYLSRFDDVSVFFTDQSYRRAHFGMDWVNWLLFCHARGKWALTVDIDEFLVYPYSDRRPLRALTDWLDASRIRYMPAQLLDLYPSKRLGDIRFDEMTDPFSILTHFDLGNYAASEIPKFKDLWIQGGVRGRVFFSRAFDRAPALNKTPLVRWKRGYIYTSSTHQLLPRHLNYAHLRGEAEHICGMLLHTKFLPDLRAKVNDEYLMTQHYSRAREYRSYDQAGLDELEFMSEHSRRYLGWQQLEDLGFISRGGWA